MLPTYVPVLLCPWSFQAEFKPQKSDIHPKGEKSNTEK